MAERPVGRQVQCQRSASVTRIVIGQSATERDEAAHGMRRSAVGEQVVRSSPVGNRSAAFCVRRARSRPIFTRLSGHRRADAPRRLFAMTRPRMPDRPIHDTEASDGTLECPFLDRNDARCASRFTVAALDTFFALCCGSFRRCPTYHRMRAEDALAVAGATSGPERIVALTTSASALGSTQPDGIACRIRANGS